MGKTISTCNIKKHRNNFFSIERQFYLEATHEASIANIMSTVVCVNGKLWWTVATNDARTPSRFQNNMQMMQYDAEILIRLLMWSVINCKCLVIKVQQKEADAGQYFEEKI